MIVFIVDIVTNMEVIDEQEELDISSSLDSSIHHITSNLDMRTSSWTHTMDDSPVRMSFYFPNKLLEQNTDKTNDGLKTAQVTDIVGRAMETYNSLSSWKKLRLYEYIFSAVILLICLLRNDLLSMCILFILCNHGYSTAMMIPHYCYSWILIIVSFFMVCRYLVQLPIVNQCVDNEGYYYFTISNACTSTTAPLLNAYQPLQLLGLLRRDDVNRSIASTMISDILIVLCVIVMRSLLKRSGLWKFSLGYHVFTEMKQPKASMDLEECTSSVLNSSQRIRSYSVDPDHRRFLSQ